MDLEVKNLFNDKKVILSKEDILKVVLFAIQNRERLKFRVSHNW